MMDLLYFYTNKFLKTFFWNFWYNNEWLTRMYINFENENVEMNSTESEYFICEENGTKVCWEKYEFGIRIMRLSKY